MDKMKLLITLLTIGSRSGPILPVAVLSLGHSKNVWGSCQLPSQVSAPKLPPIPECISSAETCIPQVLILSCNVTRCEWALLQLPSRCQAGAPGSGVFRCVPEGWCDRYGAQLPHHFLSLTQTSGLGIWCPRFRSG